MIHHPFAHNIFSNWKTLAGVFALLVLVSSSAFAQALCARSPRRLAPLCCTPRGSSTWRPAATFHPAKCWS